MAAVSRAVGEERHLQRPGSCGPRRGRQSHQRGHGAAGGRAAAEHKIYTKPSMSSSFASRSANICHDLANEPKYLKTDWGRLRAGVPGHVQLPQRVERHAGSRPFQPGTRRLPSSSSAVRAPQTHPGGITRKLNSLLPSPDLLEKLVLSMRDEHVTGEVGTPLRPPGQQKGPHLPTQLTAATPLVSLHTSDQHHFPQGAQKGETAA